MFFSPDTELRHYVDDMGADGEGVDKLRQDLELTEQEREDHRAGLLGRHGQ